MQTEVKVAKRVSFDEKSNQAGTSGCAIIMDTQKDEGVKPSFLMGGEDNDIDVEDMDEFPTGNSSNIGLAKQLSDAALIDKRRRLR